MRLAAIAVVLALLAAGEAVAHAVLIGTEPSDRAVVAAPPDSIVLTFDERVAPIAVVLLDGAGRAVLAAVAVEDGRFRVAPAAPLAAGAYLVSWRVTSADSHPISGAFQFAVGRAPESWRATSAVDGSGAFWRNAVAANKAIHLIATLLAAGGVLFLLLVERAGRLGPLLVWSALAGGLTAVLGVGLNGGLLADLDPASLASAAPWREGLASTRGGEALVSLGGFAAIAWGARGNRILLAIGAAPALASFAFSGHAATAPPRALALPVLVLHVSLAAFWIGSLVPLRRALGAAPGAAERTVRRFSARAVIAVPLMLAAGVVLAVLQVRDLSALATPGYGTTLIVKIALVTALLGVAACNRVILMPSLARDPAAAPRLRAMIAAEIDLGIAILCVTALLSGMVPPRSAPLDAAARAPNAVVAAHGHVATIAVAPGVAGRNSVTVRLADGAGRPVEARAVALFLSNAVAGIEPLERRMEPQGGGLYRHAGPELALPGIWTVRVEAPIGDFDKAVFAAELPIR